LLVISDFASAILKAGRMHEHIRLLPFLHTHQQHHKSNHKSSNLWLPLSLLLLLVVSEVRVV
jgi:branched-subunit amino acid transport protein AzlD